MKFLTYMITSVAALPLVEIEDGEACGALTKVTDAAGKCKSKKCNAVITKAEAATPATRRLAEAAATPTTCLAATETCSAFNPAPIADPAKKLAAELKAVTDCKPASGCKWAAATGHTAEAPKGECKADCKCSGTTVVSVTVAFVAAIFLL